MRTDRKLYQYWVNGEFKGTRYLTIEFVERVKVNAVEGIEFIEITAVNRSPRPYPYSITIIKATELAANPRI